MQFRDDTARSGADVPVVFCAQSKQFYYCRDAVCEFVFNAGAIPLHPFRLFAYFLGDRVARDVVRRANDTLVGRSDALWVFGAISDGVWKEIQLAEQLGLGIRFFTISPECDGIQEERVSDLQFEEELCRQLSQSSGDLMVRIRDIVNAIGPVTTDAVSK